MATKNSCQTLFLWLKELYHGISPRSSRNRSRKRRHGL